MAPFFVVVVVDDDDEGLSWVVDFGVGADDRVRMCV